jgi:hypothetical protein
MKNKESNMYNSNLLTIENAKTVKGESLGYLTGILYLAPADESVPFGGKNTCPYASSGCRAACLYTAGRGRFDKIKEARIKKTVYFFKQRENFMQDLRLSIAKIIRFAKKRGMLPAVRLNGTSDIAWEDTGIMQEFPTVQFYDYSKDAGRCKKELPKNYHLTFSRCENNDAPVQDVVKNSQTNVAVVFSNANLPASFLGRKVVNADNHDLRFLDGENVICGLKAKGSAKKDKSGFVLPSPAVNEVLSTC